MKSWRVYDLVLAGGVGAFLVLFVVLSKVLFPLITDEILLIRAFGAASFVLLHVILCIGPLCRLNPKFLPLLYNRRHAGVTMSLLALIHATLVVITYHAGGDTNPILSIFKGSPLTGSVAGVPFQPFGFVALVILLLMAATSHDFWLANLSAPVWKSLHMLVYLAYGLLVLHVTCGVLQAEAGPVYVDHAPRTTHHAARIIRASISRLLRMKDISMSAPSPTSGKSAPGLSACRESASPFSNTTAKSPQFRTSANTRTARWARGKFSMVVSLVHGTATNTCPTPAPRLRRSSRESPRSTRA